MNPHPPTAEPTQAEDAAYYRAVLHTLIDQGANIAKTLHDQITTPTNAQDLLDGNKPETSLAFDRVARAVRRTILLARKLSEPPTPARAQTAAPGQSRANARKHILRRIEDAIHEKAKPAEAEALRAELHERLDCPEFAEDLDEDLRHHPIEHVIETIRRDLGLAAHHSPRGWIRRRPEHIAALRARAAHPITPRPPPKDTAITHRPAQATGP